MTDEERPSETPPAGACPCGEPPYTDGKLCPACLEILGAEMMRKPGGMTLRDAITLMVLSPRIEEEDE